MSAFTIYVLLSLRNGKRYVGMTGNLSRRMKEHSRGASRFTSQNGPWRLLHQEQFAEKEAAMRRERFLKSGQSRAFLDNLES